MNNPRALKIVNTLLAVTLLTALGFLHGGTGQVLQANISAGSQEPCIDYAIVSRFIHGEESNDA